ncbi:hypothetical protein [Aeromicrobium endophyticum]|uniref:hypothetical protein n=1 Tax=Aeromicrobium endophyticum TaxID=2292704 RepID=UPI0011C34CAF|nr:hypothetical protein [Aeromicrobium endophyticum]
MASNVGSGGTGQGSPFFPSPAPAPAAPPASPTGTTPSTTTGSTGTAKPPTSLKARVAAVPGLDPAHLKAAGQPELQQVLESLLGALKNLSDADLQLGEKHGDGSLRITSHLAVWLIGKVTDAYGSKLVRLSKVTDRESLRSISGLANLLTNAIANKQGVTTA